MADRRYLLVKIRAAATRVIAAKGQKEFEALRLADLAETLVNDLDRTAQPWLRGEDDETKRQGL